MSNPPPSDPTQEPTGDSPGQDPPTAPGDPLTVEPYQPTAPRPTPTYQPGYASLPTPPSEHTHPPTTQFPEQPGYPPPGYGQPGYPPPSYGQPGYPPPGHGQPGYSPPGHGQPSYPPPGYSVPPRKSYLPLVAVIVAVVVLLCGGVVTAGVLFAHNVANRAKGVVKPITDPAVPTTVPNFPGVPTALPTLPTDLPKLPGIPGSGRPVTVTYEVTGDGPAEILYFTKVMSKPQRVSNAKLAWRFTLTMDAGGLFSVTAIRTSANDGTINCRTSINGVVQAHNSHDGAFGTVTCSRVLID